MPDRKRKRENYEMFKMLHLSYCFAVLPKQGPMVVHGTKIWLSVGTEVIEFLH